MTITLTLNSPALAQPISLVTDKLNFSLPVLTGKYVAVAQSVAGNSAAETVTESLEVDGFQILNNQQIADFPIDIPTAVGPIIGKLWESLDATITLTVTNP
jgi:hypothetical protein